MLSERLVGRTRILLKKVDSSPIPEMIEIALGKYFRENKESKHWRNTMLMLVFMLILPALFGGQVMIWWSTVFARIVAAVLALIVTKS